jgi:hypothetical protein
MNGANEMMLSPRMGKLLAERQRKMMEPEEKENMVYLSGPMSGLPDYNRPAFDRAAASLRAKGYRVWSPAEAFDRNVLMPRSHYMRVDIKALLDCTTVMMLPKWETSKGARLEFEIAKELELPVLLLSDDGEKVEILNGN